MRNSLFRRGPYWHGKVMLDTWTSERRYSLETKDKRVALAKLQKLVQELEADAQGWGMPRSAREAAQTPLTALCAAWLDELTITGRSPTTVRKYAAALRKICMACNWTLLEHVSATAFCQWRKGCGLRGKTVNDYLAACSGFCDWLTLKRMMRENPFEVVDPVKTHKEEREYRAKLTPEQLMALLAVSPQPRAAIYQLIAETGARRADIKGVRWGDFCLLQEGGAGKPATELARPGEREPAARGVPSAGPSVKFRASISKNGKTRIFPLTPSMAAQLRALMPADAAPFQCPFAKCVPRISTFRRDLARAGMTFHDDMGRRRDLHALRKTFGSALIANGESIYVVAHAMRHSDIRLTLRMYCDSQQFEQPLAEAIARLPWHTSATA